MKSKLSAAVAAVTLFTVSHASANAITYAVSIFVPNNVGTADGTVAIGGSITTDGTLGLMTNASHIIDWDLIGAVSSTNSGSVLFNLVGPLSGTKNSTVDLFRGSILATALTLEFNPADFDTELSFGAGFSADIFLGAVAEVVGI